MNVSISHDNLDYINAFSPHSNDSNKNFKFLIDTGANVSLIKACRLDPETCFNSKDKLILHGLSPNIPVGTEGSCQIPIQICGSVINVKFYILNQAINVPFDGLLGKDFLQRESTTIDYQSNTLTLKSVPVPIKLNTEKSEHPSVNFVSLKARTETLIEIEVENPEIQEGIIPEIKLLKGVYLSRAITKVNKDNKAYATILNTRVTDQQIKPITVRLERIPETAIFLLDNSNTSQSNRENLVKKNLRLEHLNSDEKASVLNICTEYNDIFHFSDDILTTTNAIEHKIHVTDPTPIDTKSYRYPEAHKLEVKKQIDKMLKQGIIQPSISPWSAPLWIVPKKLDASGEQKWRIVIDFRRLNDVTVGDEYRRYIGSIRSFKIFYNSRSGSGFPPDSDARFR